MHYQRFRNDGDVGPALPRRTPRKTAGTCEVQNCAKGAVGGGLCRKHYMRKVRNGDPLVVLRLARIPESPPGYHWCSAHKEHLPESEFSRSNAANCRTCIRTKRQIKNYGVAVMQGDTCATCDTDENLCIDHSHVSGAARGVLCRSCNAALGLAGDSPERLRRMAAYLS